ncbi:hypothetical protein DUNSADRAFT_9616 [Dunaliella salina]|uniref:Hydroxyisourate hydrolase n=1 Tax=Dunaliella salina TaxID=3046 RepID=A0ABQ7H5B4_DUNSA|nr:hypothetical protein DUNSADRAFT_9616 [Dunaliella salina]|eukprot:KAF5842048.1 hypothetical protein DUNSADRAFT_9616 [Dunaliella salina]
MNITYDQAFTLCASKEFANRLSRAGPFPDLEAALHAARSIWWSVPVTEWLAAFSAHPRIGGQRFGNPNSNSHPSHKAFDAHSSTEQAAASSSMTPSVQEELARWNQQYFDKFGHVFLICAKGRPAQDILASLQSRYHRLPYEELQAAAGEQMKITEQRLAGLLEGPSSGALDAQGRAHARANQQVLSQLAASSPSQPLRSPITSHVLDTALGVPARGLPLVLHKLDEHSKLWEVVSQSITNEDGRAGNLLPPSNYLAPGRYSVRFDTATYLAACKAKHPGYYANVPFYPEATVCFEIEPAKATEHYHIPLLLSPYGYSTYRGS